MFQEVIKRYMGDTVLCLIDFQYVVRPHPFRQADSRKKSVGINQEMNCRVDAKGVIDMKIPGTGTLESVQVRSRVKSFTEVTRKSSYIGTFAAGNPDGGFREP